MSFFGFDATLPRDRTDNVGIGDKTEDPFDPTGHTEEEDDNEAAFEEKLRGLRAAGQEDVEIYTWGGGGDGGGKDGLGDLLEEAGDDFNEDTFGVGDVGKDFDFEGGASTEQPGRTMSRLGFGDMAAAPREPSARRKNDAAFASTMDDFWQMPEVKPKQPPGRQPLPPHEIFAPPTTLEEVEAQLKATTGDQQPAPAPVPHRKAMTMDEVEAEMRAKRGQQATAPSDAPQVHPSFPPGAFPPLGTLPPPLPQQAHPAPPSGFAPSMRDAPSSADLFSRTRAFLQALPNPIQNRILALPIYMHFGAADSVARDYPALLVAASAEKLPQQVENPLQWPRVDGGPEQQGAIHFMINSALARIEEAHRLENKRQMRLAKIRAMAQRNNLMSRSDKDFITRIQVSQLITNDPYTNDFYAHIYFQLHGNTSRVVLPTMERQEQELAQSEEAHEQQETRRSRPRKQQPNRRVSAMVRMQQQMERIVQGRKERLEKASGSAALEGALGRVSLSSTKAPRQMLQIKPESETLASDDDKVGMGHAQDAVQQALKGASVAQGATGQKRPALTRFEVLSILEALYDTTLALEQSRRDAPADDNAQPDAAKWREQREGLGAKVWSELRVLEPLEVSDPHPFISLMSTVKGKRLLPRALRHLTSEQALTAMTMIVASFDRMDVVRESTLLDEAPSTRSETASEKRREVQRQTEAFMTSIVPSMYSLIASVPMRIVSGMLALFIQRNDPLRVAQSKVRSACVFALF